MLSKYVTRISEQVADCSRLFLASSTQSMKRKLAAMYAHMFRFYQFAIEWYLRSKVSRAFKSFNESLADELKGKVEEVEYYINEIYREGQTTIQIMTQQDVAGITADIRQIRQCLSKQDEDAGHRMLELLLAILQGSPNDKFFGANANRLTSESLKLIDPPSDDKRLSIHSLASTGISRNKARHLGQALEPFIVGEEGPSLFKNCQFAYAEHEVQSKLCEWMTETSSPCTLWISSPSEGGGIVSGAHIGAIATVAAGWQAKAPLISHFCQRIRVDQVRNGMSIEQIGIIGLVYNLIHQLLQFNQPEDILDIAEEDFAALNGGIEAWDLSIKILRSLLDHTPLLRFCVIDGLNDLAWGNGADWCTQFLEVLFSRQKRPGTVFNILLTTTGQCQVLPKHVPLKNRYMSKKTARDVGKSGVVLDLQVAVKNNQISRSED
jgi:hypothetical protein